MRKFTIVPGASRGLRIGTHSPIRRAADENLPILTQRVSEGTTPLSSVPRLRIGLSRGATVLPANAIGSISHIRVDSCAFVACLSIRGSFLSFLHGIRLACGKPILYFSVARFRQLAFLQYGPWSAFCRSWSLLLSYFIGNRMPMQTLFSTHRPAFRCSMSTGLLMAALGCFLNSSSSENLYAQVEELPAPPPVVPSPEKVVSPEEAAERVTEIQILGNDTIPTSKIASQLSTHVGRPFDRSIVQRDVRKLANLGWFVDVKPLYKTTPQGRIIIFQVVERPTIRYVTYLGNKGVSDKNLTKQTGLKAGGSVDPYAIEEGRRKIREHYQSRGYNNVQVTILEGTKATDQGIVYLINEGTSQKIWKVEFIGNEFLSDSRLKTRIKSKPPMLKLFKGYVNREQIDADVDQLTAYYRAFGYFQARIGRKLDYNKKGNWVDLTFVIREGPRSKIRNVRFQGNKIFEPEALAAAAKLTSGHDFEQLKMQRDSLWLQELYGSHGYVFADVRPEPVYLEEPGEIDLIYHIDEGEQWRVGRILVNIGGDHPHTRIQTALNRITLRSGDLMDIRELKSSERRLIASSLYHSDPASGVRPKITYRIPEDGDLGMARGNSQSRGSRRSSQGSGVRGQSPDTAKPVQVNKPIQMLDVVIPFDNLEHFRRWLQEVEPEQREEAIIVRGQNRSNHKTANATANQVWWSPTRPTARQHSVNQPQISRRPTYQTLRGQNPSVAQNGAYGQIPTAGSGTANPYGGQVVRATGPASAPVSTQGRVQPAQYVDPLTSPRPPVTGIPYAPVGIDPNYQLFPDGRFGVPGQPYPARAVDVLVDLQETQTGRLMIGAGINSDAGIVGNITLDERNFDWRRWPRNFEEVRNGTAWRGAGQRFRVDASPGSEVNRYLVSFQEPYLFDTPISLGLSGSFFDRRFRDWDEERIGGRVSLGRQWVEHDLSGTVSYRGETIQVDSISTPGLPELDEVVGDNTLHGFRISVVNDTRDSSFLPTQGHYIELSGEQVIGSFDYARGTFDYREYLLIHERPDHSGRHVLSMSAQLGFLGHDAPIYEHFFAGGVSTMRGFDFRGASPVVSGVEVGGEFQWLNSVQYLFPITADDMLHGVVFTDFGTVEKKAKVNDFRVVVGVGLRITVPAMGPAPIALDFGWAIDHADFDDREVFSFNLGFGR